MMLVPKSQNKADYASYFSNQSYFCSSSRFFFTNNNSKPLWKHVFMTQFLTDCLNKVKSREHMIDSLLCC